MVAGEENQPCHVPRLSCPSVIGTEIVEPRREAFVCETLPYRGEVSTGLGA